MAQYQLDPAEAGVSVGAPGGPTETGWKVVTPQMWYFRKNQICDKVQQPDGYADSEYWIDWTLTKHMLDLWKEDPAVDAMEIVAKAHVRLMKQFNFVIRPREIVVGHSCNDHHGIQADPLYGPMLVNQQLFEEGRCYYWDGEKKVKVDQKMFEEWCEFQKTRNHQKLFERMVPPDIFRMYYLNSLRWWEPMGGIGPRANCDWNDWVFELGNAGIREEVKKTIARMEHEAYCDSTFPADKFPEWVTRIKYMKNCLEVLEAFIEWIRGYANKARELLKEETDPWERKRLEKIADSCDWVAENPPRGLHDAVQLFEFWWESALHCENSVHSINMRVDRVFYPFYKKDLEEGRITRQEACDLMAMMMFKMHEHGIAVSKGSVRLYGMGTRDYVTCTMAGVEPETGLNSWNEMTDIILDVIDGYRLHYPDWKCRWSRNLDRKNLRRVAEVQRTGMGLPSLQSDDMAFASLMHAFGDETSLEEARDWAIVGCITPGIVRNSRASSSRNATYRNHLKDLETFIFRGKDPIPGFEWVDVTKYIDVGDVEDMKTFEELWEKYTLYDRWFGSMSMKLRNLCMKIIKDTGKRPMQTLALKRCIKEGVEVQDLDIPYLSFWDSSGAVDASDSLTAIKYWIYDKKKYTWKQLKEALYWDWEGFEDMRRDFKSAPKFGNDDDYADEIHARFISMISDNGLHYTRDLRGKPTQPSGLVITTMFAMAAQVGAMPNGRCWNEPLADCCLAPHAEFDKAGTWARLRSALKVDQTKARAWVYNQKLDYSTVEGDAGLDKLTDYLDEGMRAGMTQIQINFMSREILRDAQAHPEKYPLLSVRISGYSAYFVELPKFVQDAVIDRVDHKL